MQQFVVLIISIMMVGCSHNQQDGPPTYKVNLSQVSDPVVKKEPLSKRGNPANYTVFGKKYYVDHKATELKQQGIASWYGTKFHGKITSNGEKYDMFAMTAAHKSLPLPSYVKVTNLENNKTVVVRVNDRGPFKDERILDLSYAAAYKLDMLTKGTAKIQLETISAQQERQMFLQVAAFSSKERAEALLKNLQAHVDARPVKIDYQNSLYKVKVGPLRNKELTEQLAKKITSLLSLQTLTVYN